MSIPIIDLFAGAGGLGIGAVKAGCDLRLSVELDAVAHQTLQQNTESHGGTALRGDVRDISGQELRELAGLSRKDTLIVAGGPPCQPFSKASYWTDPGADSKYRQARAKGEKIERPAPITEARPDERRSLIMEFHRLVCESNADGFLFENVTSILHPRNKQTFLDFRQAMEDSGFQTTLIKANAADYGVPQKRQRVILLGLRTEVPGVPAKTHSKVANGLPCYVTCGTALKPFRAKEYAEKGEEVTGRWEAQLREIPPGKNYKALTEWAGHPNPVFVAETRFWNFLLKLHPDLVSWTIAASPGPWTGPFHWDSRRLRTVEMAALQNFPAGYEFAGSRRDRVRQIGNALPPNMATACLAPLVNVLSGAS